MKIQDKLRSPIKHPQQLVTRCTEAAAHIDALEKQIEDLKWDLDSAHRLNRTLRDAIRQAAEEK